MRLNIFSGRTPLHVAVDQGQKDIVEMLIKKGAVVSAINLKKRTPLHLV
ncbi:MAG: ankyrin repeat domain-containing protein [Planctomycetota bacterium]|nr:MAG: ankyrin repeat domain-containing protein [Planctomycetota bacterium]